MATPVTDAVFDKIHRALKASHTSMSNRFLSQTSLSTILTSEKIEGILKEIAKKLNRTPEDSIPKLAEFVNKRALSVFASLIIMRNPYLIEYFNDDEFQESMFPAALEQSDLGWTVKSYISPEYDAVLNRIIHTSWIREFMAFFVDHQWKFLPLVLVERKFRYETFDQTRLPFIQIDQLPETSKSGHSCVQKNTIHRDCFQIKIETAIDQHMNPYVAYKTLNSNAIREAEKEASVLETIREIENAHLVKAIAYIYDDKKTKHSFLFPWAEYGNLRDFWNQQTPSRDRKYFVNAFRQLTCLASALDDLSDKNIRHGDLKPENIVCFRTDNGLPVGDSEDMVRLVIIDVGISKKHHNDTSDRRATETKVSTRRYAAPELETKTEKERSRRADVWSLGCIFLEFVIWLLYGNDELKHFTKHFDEGSGNMKFFVIDSEHLQTPQMKTAIRHPEVGKTIAKITADPRCPSGTGIRRLVDLISDRLLAVDLSDEDPPKPKLNSEGYSICRCVYNKAMDQVVNSIHNCDPGIKSISEPKPTPPPPGPEISIEAPSVPSEKASQPTTGGRPYARPVRENLERITALLENGSIDPIAPQHIEPDLATSHDTQRNGGAADSIRLDSDLQNR